MADSNSTSPRCPCGFWGTPQTGGLCSKCYKDKEQKLSGVAGATSLPMTSLTKPMNQDIVQTPQVSAEIENGASKLEESDGNSSDNNISTERKEENTNSPSDNVSDVAAEGTSGENGSKKRDSSEVQEDAMDCEEDLPIQKNKKRCFKCHTRLELAIREIGRCQCNYVFCQMHRLPEQHDCIYDHKEKGRKQARDKMVSPKKHAGTSIKRMDSHS